ncbi:MAG: restriction endonuclease subunit [Ramlibacter sp.]|nr:restriction endonuclease subunit [Ramlibacter sp.]
MAVPKKVAERLVAGIKRYQAILTAAKSRDVGEADTVTIVKDMLAEVFGYDKYAEVTSEFAIRGTYCDLAIKVDGVLQTLIEVKAVGLDLKEAHVKQAIDYAANQGVDWVLLTNGVYWRVYHVIFSKPIEQELVVDIDFTTLSSRSDADLDHLYLWCKEGWQKSVLAEYHHQKQALSRFFVGGMLLTDPVLDVIRRELRRISPDVKIDADQIRAVLTSEVIKREVLEGDKADEARKKIGRAAAKALRQIAVKPSKTQPEVGLLLPKIARDDASTESVKSE